MSIYVILPVNCDLNREKNAKVIDWSAYGISIKKQTEVSIMIISINLLMSFVLFSTVVVAVVFSCLEVPLFQGIPEAPAGTEGTISFNDETTVSENT